MRNMRDAMLSVRPFLCWREQQHFNLNGASTLSTLPFCMRIYLYKWRSRSSVRGLRVVTNGDCFKSHTPIRHWEHYILHTDSQIADEMFSTQNEWIHRAKKRRLYASRDVCGRIFVQKFTRFHADTEWEREKNKKKSKARNRNTTFLLGLRTPRLACDEWRKFSTPLLYHLISKLFHRIYSESA